MKRALLTAMLVGSLMVGGCTANQMAMVISDAIVKVENRTDQKIKARIDQAWDPIVFFVSAGKIRTQPVVAGGQVEQMSLTIFVNGKSESSVKFRVRNRTQYNTNREMHVFVFERTDREKDSFVLRQKNTRF